MKVYAFKVTLRKFGVLVEEGKDPMDALRGAWTNLGEGLGEGDWDAYSVLVKEFPETDEGWDAAADLGLELIEYGK